MCSFGGFMGIGLCLTDSIGTSESERVKTEPTADSIALGWKWNAAQAKKVGTHAAAFMVLSENAPWGTPPVMAIFARRQVAICVGSSRCAPECLSGSHGIHSPLSYRAPSNAPAHVSARTLADLERGSIRPRPRPRLVCVAYRAWRRR
jgi:hypothetical protein